MRKSAPLSISEAVQQNRISSLGSSDVVSRAVHGIEKLISDRRFAPGQRLIEAELVRALGLGRGPVREALRILAGDGVVELSANKGARIRVIDRPKLIEMMQVLTGLFCMGVDFFTSRPQTERSFKALHAVARQIKQAARRNDKHALNLHFIEYHQIALHFSGNKYLSYLFERVHIAHYQSAVEATLDSHVLRELAQSYDDITQALESGDAALAKAILTKQMVQVIAYMESSSPFIDQALEPLLKTRKSARRSIPRK